MLRICRARNEKHTNPNNNEVETPCQLLPVFFLRNDAMSAENPLICVSSKRYENTTTLMFVDVVVVVVAKRTWKVAAEPDVAEDVAVCSLSTLRANEDSTIN